MRWYCQTYVRCSDRAVKAPEEIEGVKGFRVQGLRLRLKGGGLGVFWALEYSFLFKVWYDLLVKILTRTAKGITVSGLGKIWV